MAGGLNEGRDIIFFAGIDWDGGNKMPCHHVVERLARHHRVFYVDNFGGVRDLTGSDCGRAWRKVWRIGSRRSELGGQRAEDGGQRIAESENWKGGESERTEGGGEPFESDGEDAETIGAAKEPYAGGGITVDRPLIIPTPRTRVLQMFNGWLLNRRIKKLIQRHRIEKPIIWTRLPIELVWRAIDGVDRSLLLYQMIDKFPEHPKIAQSLRGRHGHWERWFTENADVVFASARGLWEEKKAVNPESYFFPNGASEIFRSTGTPGKVAGERSPVIGFAGAVGTSLDLEWLSDVARERPRYRFVLLGTIDPEIDLSTVERMPNVVLQGRVEHSSLPDWFSGFDAAFMAYRCNDYQKYTFPSKMAEYLLAGLPVVSNRVPEVEPYGDVVHIVETPEEMASALDRAIEERVDGEMVAKRKEVGESLSWDRIVEGMEEVIRRKIGKWG